MEVVRSPDQSRKGRRRFPCHLLPVCRLCGQKRAASVWAGEVEGRDVARGAEVEGVQGGILASVLAHFPREPLRQCSWSAGA